jgi:acyl-CoA reductase LuxC
MTLPHLTAVHLGVAESRAIVPPYSNAPTVGDLEIACGRLRDASQKPIDPLQVAAAIAQTVSLWRDRKYVRRVDTIARIAGNAGFSIPLLNDSLDALLRPFSADALLALAGRVRKRTPIDRADLIGFIMAANVAGAGLHEVAIALVAGATLLIKTASSEPHFFSELVRTLDEIAPEVASRVAIFNWPRDRTDLTSVLTEHCVRIVAYGDDNTIESLKGGKLIGFGSRVSGAVVSSSAVESPQIASLIDLLARDVAYFEQLGCLSPHHVFIVTPEQEIARNVAFRLSTALEQLSKTLPPARIPLADAAKIVSVRENARWRRIAGDAIDLWEAPRLAATTIFDPDASFAISPGFRTIVVSAVRNFGELRERLAPATGWLEALAFAGSSAELEQFRVLASDLGVSYIAMFGEMQSPPLDWRHGAGKFLDAIVGGR